MVYYPTIDRSKLISTIGFWLCVCRGGKVKKVQGSSLVRAVTGLVSAQWAGKVTVWEGLN